MRAFWLCRLVGVGGGSPDGKRQPRSSARANLALATPLLVLTNYARQKWKNRWQHSLRRSRIDLAAHRSAEVEG